MLLQLIGFELKYHSKQLLFWLGVVVMLLMGILMANTGRAIYINSPYQINYIGTLLSLFSIFVTAVFCSSAILRDFDNKMSEILYASPIDKLHYLVSRFSGLVMSTTIIVIMGLFGFFLAAIFAPFGANIGPIHPEFYLWSLVVIIIPNILLNSALLFSTALFSRSAIMTYICGLLLYMLYMVASMLGNSPLMAQSTPVSPENAALSALLEPYGLIGFYEQTRYWTVFEKNTQQVALTGTFLFNRMFWTGLSLILFAATYRVFAFRSVRIKHAKTTEGSAFIGELLPYRTVMPDFREKFIDIAALFSKIKIEYISVIKGLPFIVIAISMVFIVGIEISQQLGRGIYTVPFYPSTGLIVPNIQEIISKVGFFIILFYAAELYWNERSVKINELVDTSPAKSITFYLSKLAVLATIISTLIFISIAVSIAYQLFRGYFELRLDLYLSLFLYSGYGLLLDAILALFLQNFVKNKYLGIGLSFLVFSYAVILSKMGVPMHELSSYGHMPEFIFSDMADFVFYGQAEKWYLLYWTGIAIILVSISLLIWKRGYGRKINGLGSTDYYLPVIGLLIAIYAGSYVYYQADIVNERMNQTERLDFSERYEKKYYQYADLAQPTISSVNLQVDLYPEQRRYDVNGYYMLTNKSSEPIDRILIGIRKQNALTAEIAIEAADLESYDETYQIYWFKPKQTLAVGDSLKMTIHARVDQSVFGNVDTENYIIENGSYIEISKYLAHVGYSDVYEINDPEERKKRELPERLAFPELDNQSHENADRIKLDLLISTAADQIPITTGYVVKQWQENNRAYFHYKMDKEVMNWYAISSARYAVKQTTHRGIGIRFYYHPRHETNVSTMIESAKASLDYYIDNFGPYRYSQLKYAELPNFSYSFGATSYPNTIYSVEFRGFHMDQTNPENLNVAYLQVSHEIAHQWWADQLEPAIMAGYRFLTETLAEYSETSVYRQKYGMNGLKQYLSEMTNLYLRQRGFSSADEKPLYLAQDQSFVNYQKGVLAMHALRGLIGEEKINLALSRFINDNSYPKNPTSTELLDYFYQVADSADYQQIDDLFKRVVIYDIGIDSVETTRRGREQELNIKLSAEKIINTDNGQAIEALNEVIEIAIYSGDPRLESSQLLYLQKHRVSSKTSWIKLIVDQSASHVVIDPNYYKIERDRFNNVYKLN